MPPRNRATETEKADVETPDTDAAPVQDTRAETKADDKDQSSESKSDSKSGSSSGTEYLNTTGGPIVYDKEGHVVGGGEWVTLSGLDVIGKAARQNGFLLPKSAL